jgi:ABC-type transport system involved in cytochrome c biogenesis permease subunit
MELKELKSLAILEAGRQKPLDTFARETVRFITGKETFAGFDATELILSWLTDTKTWEAVDLISVDYRPLIKQLQLSVAGNRIAPAALAGNAEFKLFVQSTASRQQEGLPLNETEREAARLSQKLQGFYRIAEGANLWILPRARGAWESLAELSQHYPKVSLHEAAPGAEVKVAAGVQGLLMAYHEGDTVHFQQIALLLKKVLRSHGESLQNYPSETALSREIFFNRAKPFRWAWVGYAAACFCLALSFAVPGRWLYRIGVGVFVMTFLIHGFGFALRSWVAGRAPVTNMYETVLWIPFGAALFALLLEAIYRSRIFLLAGGMMAAIGLLLADSSPAVLDPAINPLVPVLKNNFWLTIHVLTITLSYGAFTLALGVANFNMGLYLFRPETTAEQQSLHLFIYRAIQIGVVLLAAGTILGGVWANQSWGRFWGWDPKEVWALIALLGYLALLHGRFAGWVKGFGLTLGAIVAYLLIVMAWYGVNFILGVGLHSYGFSSGGAKFVSCFVLAEVAWVLAAVFRIKIFPQNALKNT